MLDKNPKIRVRFAPSPTGDLHLGGARTALFNWLFARKNQGKFLVRIEDTDRQRVKPEFENAILNDLQWLGLDWDEGPGIGGPVGPYRQSERAPLYREQLKRLLAEGKAYPCFCRPQDLARARAVTQEKGEAYRYPGTCRGLSEKEIQKRKQEKHPFAVRLKLPDGKIRCHDLIRGAMEFDSRELDDFILVRSTGEPTFLFVNTVDDGLMGITHVLRGDDHLSNTPKQVALAQALGWKAPLFGHFPLIIGADRAPLSKRHGAVAVSEFRRQGYLPEALLNFLALLGWSLDDKTEFFTKQELIHHFSLERVQKNPARFDYEKLKWMNGSYIRRADPERIYQLCLEYLWNADAIDETFMKESGAALKRMISAVKGNLKTIADVGEELTYFLGEVHSYDPSGVGRFGNPQTIPILEKAVEVLEEMFVFNAMELEQRFRKEAQDLGCSFGDLVHAMRLAITGRTHSPNLFELIEILGRGRCIVRLKRFIHWIQEHQEAQKT